MIFYTTPPLVEFLRSSKNGDSLKLRRKMKYYIGNKVLTVPKGFLCDGMSVPRAFWSLVSPIIHPDTIAASIAHDYLYRFGEQEGWSRCQADLFFYCVLRSDGVSVYRAIAAFLAVRLFGKKHYRRQGTKKCE